MSNKPNATQTNPKKSAKKEGKKTIAVTFEELKLALQRCFGVGENSKEFTIVWYYGGKFFIKPNNLKYEHGKVEYMDFFDVDDFSKLTVDRVAKFMKYLGYKLSVGVLYKRDMIEDVKLMFSGIGSSKLVIVYFAPPSRTFVLSYESLTVKWKSNVVIEEILEP
ncbi:hypothetical protein Fot_07699 [Forsythia ovata]|uniref:PB1-like domain-containing protein n=1 Tax=Forsythia ovata TaxID=205694 RepID=A0ABD1WXC1_9LAMI